MKTRESVIALLNQARENGVYLFLDNKTLRLKMNKNELVNPEFLAALKLHKEEITHFLFDEAGAIKQSQEASPSITRYNREDVDRIPLSFAQERLWFIDNLRGSENYHISFVTQIKGPLDKGVLERAFKEMIQRHEVLRTVFVEVDGIASQEIRPAETWSLSYTEVTVSEAERDELVQREVAQPFRLSEDAMIRAHLIRMGGEEHRLVIVIHHIASDGWSMSIFIKELLALYVSFRSNQPPDLSPLPVQYADYAFWQRAYLSGDVLEEKLNYWKERLGGVATLELPADHKRPATPSFRGQTLHDRIDQNLSLSLEVLSRKEGVTLFMTLLTAFKILLYRYTGEEDICVGVPVANRTRKEIAPLIGFFVNTLALRTDLGNGPGFDELLARVKETTLTAYQHQDVPFEKVVDRVLKNRDLSRSPLFQVLFVLQEKGDTRKDGAGDLSLSSFPFESRTTKFDLSFSLTESIEGIHVHVEYSTDLYREETIERMIRHYKTLLQSIVQNPSQEIDRLKMLTSSEEQTYLQDFNNTEAFYPGGKTITKLFAEGVSINPDGPAVIFEGRGLSYRELDERSNRCAAYLLDRYAVKPGDLIGVRAARDEWLIVLLLGILKAGCAYVPIDPAYPEERTRYITEDSRCKVVVDKPELDRFREEEAKYSGKDPGVGELVQPDALAYVIYTSGSTGQPKGVMIQHRSVSAFLNWCRQEFQGSDFDTVLAVTSICFDLSVFEIFYTLCSGKKLRVLPDALSIPLYIPSSEKLLVNTVPSVVGNLLDEQVDLSAVRVLNMAGEPIPDNVLSRLDCAGMEIRNLYGPSEDTTYSTVYRLGKHTDKALIGRPIANTRIYILNGRMELQPIGVAGEICISGEGLAKGYLNKKELTAEKFVTDPFRAGGRMYRTGDIGRWMPDGNIDFIGRKDDQVKIRGYRIEPGEIEVALRLQPSVDAAVIIAKSDERGDKRLIAYVAGKQPIDLSGLRRTMTGMLPAYLQPNHYIQLERLPLTVNGKIDKKRLPDPDAAYREEGKSYVAPVNETEEKLVLIWRELLGKERIGTMDNFFEAGGHSMVATRVMARIKKTFSVQLPISALFEYPTIAALAERIVQQEESRDNRILIAIQIKGKNPPLFSAPPAGGNVLLYYGMSSSLGEEYPLYAFQAPGIDLVSAPLESVEEMAAVYIREMQKVDPQGPYTLMGYSFGGGVVYEMALQLIERGFSVRQLIIFDSVAPDRDYKNYKEMLPRSYAEWLIYFSDIYNLSMRGETEKLDLTLSELAGKQEAEQLQLFYEKLSEKDQGVTLEQLKAYTDVYRINASISYVPSRKALPDIPIILFRASQVLTAFTDEQMRKREELLERKVNREDLGWSEYTRGEVKIFHAACSHLNMMEKSNVAGMAAYLKENLIK